MTFVYQLYGLNWRCFFVNASPAPTHLAINEDSPMQGYLRSSLNSCGDVAPLALRPTFIAKALLLTATIALTLDDPCGQWYGGT
jgi:hypothetical protein